jgi:hypothetical protein
MLALWETQQTFVNIFQGLEYDENYKSSSSKLAEQKYSQMFVESPIEPAFGFLE